MDGEIHHLTARSRRRQPIFRDQADRQRWQQLFALACAEHHWRCLAYCLLDTQLHLVITTPAGGPAAGLRWLQARYAEHFRRRHRSACRALQDNLVTMRLQPDAYLIELLRYVLRLPVRLGLAPVAAGWRYSSAAASLGLAPAPEWLDTTYLHRLLGPDRSTGQAALRRLLGDELTRRAG